MSEQKIRTTYYTLRTTIIFSIKESFTKTQEHSANCNELSERDCFIVLLFYCFIVKQSCD